MQAHYQHQQARQGKLYADQEIVQTETRERQRAAVRVVGWIRENIYSTPLTNDTRRSVAPHRGDSIHRWSFKVFCDFPACFRIWGFAP